MSRQPLRHLSSAVLLIIPALLLAATITSSGGRGLEGGPTPSLFTERDPIVIDGNAGFTPENGVVSGSGTRGNPYVIGPWYIPARSGPAVRITNTDAYFVVQDIQTESTGYNYEAVVVSDASNGRIERIDGQGRNTMIFLERVRDFVVTGNRLLNSGSGVRLEDSVGVVVSANEIGVYGEGIAAARSSQVTITDNRVSGSRALHVVETRDVVAEGNVVGEGTVRLYASEQVAVRSNELRTVEINASLFVTLERNTLVYGGLVVEGANLNHFASHTITGNTVDGRSLRYEKGCHDLVVDGESLAQLIVVDCERVRASNLTLDRVAVGIHLAFVRWATVTSNRVITNGWGIRLLSSTDSVLMGNVIFSTSNPIYLERTARILVRGNNVVNYGIPVDTNGTENSWYAPYPEGGNYWSYHTAPDYCSGPSQDICDGGDGLLDWGTRPGNGIDDRYPLAEPFGMAGEKPNVSFDWSPQPVPLGGITYFRADVSSDPNGEIWFYEWDFGDGAQWTGGNRWNGGWATSHIYTAQGRYVATLKIIDDQGLSAIVSHLVNVTEPEPRPVAQFTAPSRAVTGQPGHFDASASSTPRGVIEAYNWNFGDGTTAQERMVDHVYESEGTFVVTLEVRNDLGYSALTQAIIEVVPRIRLVPYSDPSGFSIPVPETWGRVTNVEFEGLVIELGLLGPYDGDFQTNIIIDTDVDATLRESDASLLELANSAISDIRTDDPSAAVLEEPSVRTLGGHGAVVFALRYPLENLVQKFAVVVSEPHARYWLLILTTTTRIYDVMNVAFEEMLGGFEITLAATPGGPEATLGPVVLGIAGTVALAAAIVVLAARSRQRRGRLPPIPKAMSAKPASLGPPPLSPWKFCGWCGAATQPGAHFCGRCGKPLGR